MDIYCSQFNSQSVSQTMDVYADEQSNVEPQTFPLFSTTFFPNGFNRTPSSDLIQSRIDFLFYFRGEKRNFYFDTRCPVVYLINTRHSHILKFRTDSRIKRWLCHPRASDSIVKCWLQRFHLFYTQLNFQKLIIYSWPASVLYCCTVFCVYECDLGTANDF